MATERTALLDSVAKGGDSFSSTWEQDTRNKQRDEDFFVNGKFVYRSDNYYSRDWTRSFDGVFFLFMVVWFVVMVVMTYYYHPKMILYPGRYWLFWLFQLIKVVFMISVAFLGGLIIVNYRNVKVNYTRKIQHFCAYLVPLVFQSLVPHDAFASTIQDRVICAWWGYYFTLFSFFLLIQPFRTRFRVLDVCFACLDRPEDRPYTLKWLSTQIFLGYVILSIFTTYCEANDLWETRELVYIPVIVTGIGDGLAEPVGIAWGKHKYRTRAMCSDRSYTRSYEGSACVFLSGVISCVMFYAQFKSFSHFIVAFLTLPILETIAEAYAPHTWDTPFLMGMGVTILIGISMMG